jgi:hypothetical protein
MPKGRRREGALVREKFYWFESKEEADQFSKEFLEPGFLRFNAIVSCEANRSSKNAFMKQNGFSARQVEQEGHDESGDGQID